MENNLTGNRRVALYVRTATEPASGEVPAYAVQEAHLRDGAASNSTFQIVGVYRDIACSGTDTPKLPELQRLLSDCRTGRVDDILTKNISRIGRSITDVISVTRELSKLHPSVGIIFEAEHLYSLGSQSESMPMVLSLLAEQESRTKIRQIIQETEVTGCVLSL